MRLLGISDLLHEVFVEHEGVVGSLEDAVRWVPRARLGEAEHLEYFASDGLDIHVCQYILHLILRDVMIGPVPHYLSDLLVYDVSDGSKNLLQHGEIGLLSETLGEL